MTPTGFSGKSTFSAYAAKHPTPLHSLTHTNDNGCLPFYSVREWIQISLSEEKAESSETTVCKKPAKPIQGDISLSLPPLKQSFKLSEIVKLPQKSANADKQHWVTE